MNKYLIAIIIVISLIAGWRIFSYQKQTQKTPENRRESGNIKLVSPEEFDRLAKDKKVFILDVHIPEQTHIPGTDTLIAYNRIENNIDKLPQNKTTPILIYCRSGSMSREASQTLVRLGYTKIFDLKGGINEYKKTHKIVTITPDRKDLGTVIYGDIAETEFTLTNFTSDPISVTRISTSCGCTTAKLDKEKLGSYDSTVVRVSFNPAFHKDDTDLGELSRTVYLETDNPDYPKVTAEITANVIK